MTRNAFLVALSSVAVLAGCVADSPVQPVATTPHTGPSASVISDGNHGGNAHFYFLPPMLPATSYAGTFDSTRQPVVRITEDGEPLAELGATMSVEDEHYRADWHTAEYDLDSARTYRIAVVVDGRVLGFADVDVVSTGAAVTRAGARQTDVDATGGYGAT